MKRIIFLVSLFVAVNVQAQTHCWSWANKVAVSASKVACDANNNVYTIGYFSGSTIFGNDTLHTYPDSLRYYIAKYNTSGTLQWAKKFGDTSTMPKVVNAMTIGKSGSIYTVGIFIGNVVFGTDTLKGKGDRDGFIAKLDNAGNPVWAKSVSSAFADAVNDVAVDDSDNVYITGKFTGKFSLDTNITARSSDVFVAKLNTSGVLIWARKASDTSNAIQEGLGISVDKNQNVCVTGWFMYNIFFGTAAVTLPGWGNIFLASYDRDGNVQWAKAAGGMGINNIGISVKHDKKNNIYIAGQFADTAYFGNHFIVSRVGNYADNFLAKYDSSGQALWAQNTYGFGYGYGGPLVVDEDGNAYINKDSAGSTITCFDTSGARLWSYTPVYNTYFYFPDFGGMAMDANNSLLVVGAFKGSAGFGSYNLSGSTVNSNGFLAKMTIFPSSVNKLGGSKNEHDIYLSPNPASNMVAVDVQGMSSYDNIKVYDQLGRVVFNQHVAKMAQVKQINLGYLANGIYYLQASGGGQVSKTKKIIIQR